MGLVWMIVLEGWMLKMTEWMEHLTHDDVRRIRLVSQALKWSPERVVKTPFTILIRELACKVLELVT
jgi:hypothetical protein